MLLQALQGLQFSCLAVFRLFGVWLEHGLTAHTEHGPAPLCFPAHTAKAVSNLLEEGTRGAPPPWFTFIVCCAQPGSAFPQA